MLASCTKTEVNYDSQKAIAIVPVTQNITKAAVSGVPAGQELSVYANYTDGDGHTDGDEYLTGAVFSGNSGIWQGRDQVYFWPKSGAIKLSGHTTIDNSIGTPVYDYANKKIVVNQYTQPLSTSDAVDFLWFKQTDPLNYNNTNSETPNLEVTLQHAMAWVTIKAYGVSGSVGWKIKSITLDDVLNRGKLTCSTSGATWENVVAEVPEEDLVVYQNNDGYLLTETPTAVETINGGTLLVPQTPTKMTVTYETSGGASQKKTLDLKISDTAAENKWEAGKHYVYNLLFNPYKIEFSVNVDNTWAGNGEITIN